MARHLVQDAGVQVDAHDSDAFLFPRYAEGRGQSSLVACWRAVCADAKLGRLRLHDLRHTAASHHAVMSGETFLSSASCSATGAIARSGLRPHPGRRDHGARQAEVADCALELGGGRIGILHGDQRHRPQPVAHPCVHVVDIVVIGTADGGGVAGFWMLPTDSPSEVNSTARSSFALSRNASQSAADPGRWSLAVTRSRTAAPVCRAR